MRFSVLSSGSKANCTLVESGGIRVLIDCGLSGKQAEARMRSLGIEPASIDAILITHEHHDHVHGVATLSKRYKIPVFANEGTASALSSTPIHEHFKTGELFNLKQLEIVPFSIVHDATEPVGFALRASGFKLVYLTDLGRVTTLVKSHVQGCNAIILESNHDQEMLQLCSYTWQLKQRIASTHGHLCNDTAGQLLLEMMHPELFHVVLGHLSENSNTPTLALESARRYLEKVGSGRAGLKTLLCGSVYESTPLLDLDGERACAIA